MKFEDDMNEEVAAELEQYANAAHEMKGIEKK
jgi:hydrophobic/amphiphilic exporter-1 (mainly G- bacteria), HAE1 family